MSKKITTVIFDLDGTLLDTIKDLAMSLNFCMSMFDGPEFTVADLKNMVGTGKYGLMDKALPGGRDNPNYEACVTMFPKYYEKHMLDHTVPFMGIDMMLGALYREGYKMAIVSNKFDAAVKELNRMFFDDVITVAIGEQQGVSRKPAPDTVFKAMEELKVKPEECIYVGDSEIDIMTAQNAGIPCISVTWGFKTEEFLLEHGATQIVDDPEEIIDLLNEMNHA